LGDEQQRAYPHIVRAVLSVPWAIDPNSLAWAVIVEVLALRSAGIMFTEAEIQARIEAAQNGPRRGGGRPARGQTIGIVPIYGVIAPRQSLMSSSGGTSVDAIGRDFREAVDDPDLDGVLLDIDSPGGVVDGVEELAAEIRAARGRKPIVAIANHMAASAAYWIASAADELVATPSAQVGSIGIFTAHEDLSEALAKEGVKRTIVSAGKYKAEGALGSPLSPEAIAHLQEQVDERYAMFTSAVARGRGVSVETVRNRYGEGRSVMAKKALAAGMIDRIDTFDATVRRIAKGEVGSRPLRSPQPAAALGEPPLLAGPIASHGTDTSDGSWDGPANEARLPSERGPLRAAQPLSLAASAEAAAAAVATGHGGVPLEGQTSTPARRRDLDLLEDAFRGGYSLTD
jgi:signal peptide peptidase SppA